MILYWLVLTWDEGMPRVQSFTDQSDAIECVKDCKPYMKTFLYVTDETGVMHPLDTSGW